MRRDIFCGLAAVLAGIFLCGCTSFETLEPSDLSIVELEEKMERAMDPDGAFRKSSSYVQREMLKIKGVFFDDIFQIDLKYKKPGFLKLTYLENNQPLTAVIYNAGSAWQVDYNEKTVKEITGSDLIRLNMLHKLTTPTEKYSQLFKDVKVYRCKIADDAHDYYKIVCNPGDEDNTISIYVSAVDFMPRRIDADLEMIAESKKVEFDFDCIIESYESMDGVMIPQKATSISNGIESTTTVFEYKLNLDIPDSEFLPPVFVENKLRNRMDRFYNDRKQNRGFRRQNRRD